MANVNKYEAGKEIYKYITKANGEIIKKDTVEIDFSSRAEKLAQLKELKNELENNINGHSHLCFDCANAYSSKCPKIADKLKKDIEGYSFIEGGYQLIKDNLLDTFLVSHCSNFEKDQPKKLSAEELKSARLARESLLVYFYDTATYEEALLKEYDLSKLPSDSDRYVKGSNPICSAYAGKIRNRISKKKSKEKRR